MLQERLVNSRYHLSIESHDLKNIYLHQQKMANSHKTDVVYPRTCNPKTLAVQIVRNSVSVHFRNRNMILVLFFKEIKGKGGELRRKL